MDSVYFVSAGDTIKIGYTSNLKSRLAALQTGSAKRITVLAILPNAGSIVERYLHQAFAADRRTGEWFQASGRLTRFASFVRQGARPTTPDHISALLRYIDDAKAERRLLGRPRNRKLRLPTVVPEGFRGTKFEKLIMDLDAITRREDIPQLAIGHAHRALRKALRGHIVDLGLAAEYISA